MYRITVRKIGHLRSANVTASHIAALTDRLEASAGRNGFVVSDYSHHGGLPFGDLTKGGVRKASWFIEEVSA